MDDTTHEETEALLSSTGMGGLNIVIVEKSGGAALFKAKLMCLFNLVWHRFPATRTPGRLSKSKLGYCTCDRPQNYPKSHESK